MCTQHQDVTYNTKVSSCNVCLSFAKSYEFKSGSLLASPSLFPVHESVQYFKRRHFWDWPTEHGRMSSCALDEHKVHAASPCF